MNNIAIERVGLGIAEGFIDEIQDDLRTAIQDGKISRHEAIQLFSVLLKYGAKFGITLLEMQVKQDGNTN